MTSKDWGDLEAVEDTIERNEERMVDGRPFYADPSLPVPEDKPLTTADFPAYMTAHYWKSELIKAKLEAQAAMNELNNVSVGGGGGSAISGGGGTGFTHFYADKPKKPKRKELQARIENLERELTKLKDEIADQDVEMWAYTYEGVPYVARITSVKIKQSKLHITGTVLAVRLTNEFTSFRIRIADMYDDKKIDPPVHLMPSDTLNLTYASRIRPVGE